MRTGEGERALTCQLGLAAAAGPARSLNLTLTDPADPLFYYSATILEEDFRPQSSIVSRWSPTRLSTRMIFSVRGGLRKLGPD